MPESTTGHLRVRHTDAAGRGPGWEGVAMRIVRSTIIIGACAALALTVGAAPALADGPVRVTSLPAEVTIPAGGSVSVNVPNADVCAKGTLNLKVTVPGNQDAVAPLMVPGAGCSAGQLNYSIVDNPNSLKRNAVVKFTADRAGGGRVVQTLVIKVTGDQQGQGQANRVCKDHGRNSCLLQ